MSNNDLSVFSFRNNSGTAQYSMNNGSSWTNFKNPVGTKNIYSNGTYDVTNYASAYVSVSTSLSETTLWTNSSPTSNFGNQDISLNQSIDNFKYIAIYTRASTSNSTETVSIFSVSFVKTTDTTRGWDHPKMTIGCTPSTYGFSARYFGYVSTTSIRAYSIIRVVDDGSVSQPTSIHIPTKITGLK